MGELEHARNRNRGADRSALNVAVYKVANHTRSRVICDALMSGIREAGDVPTLFNESDYRLGHLLQFDACAFYSLEGNCRRIFKDFSTKSTAVFVDLGYFGPRDGGRWCGFHKVVVNARHPTTYFQSRGFPRDRLERFHVKPATWRPATTDGHILLAGMSDKAANAEGFQPEYWERNAAETLRACTRRPIVYRPKPNWDGAKPITGTKYSKGRTLAEDFQNCWAVVTHHSNVAVHAVLAGVPVCVRDGVALSMGISSLNFIEHPYYPGDAWRQQWAQNLAYTQWNVEEISQGLPWRHLKLEGLLA